jgi:hypothetical protein
MSTPLAQRLKSRLEGLRPESPPEPERPYLAVQIMDRRA